jgi:TonB family protein
LRLVAPAIEADPHDGTARAGAERALLSPMRLADAGLPAEPAEALRERALGLTASILLHLLIATGLVLWRDEVRDLAETSVMQVELATLEEPLPPPTPPRPPVPPKEYLLSFDAPKLPDYATMHTPLLQLDPSLKLDRLRRAAPGHGPSVNVPEAESGDLAGGDAMQNYALVVMQMVHAQLEYPASAALRRERGIVRINVEVGSDGALLDVHAATAGSFDFAEAARKAARAAAPFPPFPLMVAEPKLGINFAVVFQYSE